MSAGFHDGDVISITDFSREEILYLCEAGRRMWEMEKTGRRNSLRDTVTMMCANRRPYTVAHRKVTDPEKLAFLQKLPVRIEPVAYPD